jgi:hypothetical protein
VIDLADNYMLKRIAIERIEQQIVDGRSPHI